MKLWYQLIIVSFVVVVVLHWAFLGFQSVQCVTVTIILASRTPHPFNSEYFSSIEVWVKQCEVEELMLIV